MVNVPIFLFSHSSREAVAHMVLWAPHSLPLMARSREVG